MELSERNPFEVDGDAEIVAVIFGVFAIGPTACSAVITSNRLPGFDLVPARFLEHKAEHNCCRLKDSESDLECWR